MKADPWAGTQEVQFLSQVCLQPEFLYLQNEAKDILPAWLFKEL